MKAIIIEDEKLAASRLKKMVREVDEKIHIDGIFDGVKEAQSYLNDNKHPEIIFLDIHLSDGNAFDLLERVEVESHIIFTTAYDDYVEKAFDGKAFDYLLKPIRKNELKNSISRIKSTNTTSEKKVSKLKFDNEASFLIRYGSRYHVVNINEIACMYNKEGVTILVNNQGKSLPCNIRLSDVYKHIDKRAFCLINNKLILNINTIKKIESNPKYPGIKLILDPKISEDFLITPDQYKQLASWLNQEQNI